MNTLSSCLRPKWPRPWWSYASAAILATGSLWAAHYASVTSGGNDILRERIDAEHARRAAAVPAKPTPAELELKKQWQQLALERDFDWESIFLALQNANHTDIELLEFRPEKRQGVIVLRGEAKSAGALSEYLQKVAGQPAFEQVYLTRQDLRAHGPLETVGFEMRGKLHRRNPQQGN